MASTNRKEEEDDTLWEDFESCAHAVAVLYRSPSWRAFEISAAAATQLYKQGVEAERRAMERGRAAGRQALAKEMIAFYRCNNGGRGGSGALEDLLAMAQQIAAGPVMQPHQSRNASDAVHLDDGVQLFREALAPPTSTAPPSPNRSQLGSFLLRQLHRHRKRSHSPGSSPSSPSSQKRFCRR